MRKTETVELTVLCLIEDGNRILLQNRVKKDWQGYALPGGHVEPGESFVDAVIREMKEETGLTVIEPRLAGVKQFPIENGRYVVLLFKATRWFGDLISSDEGQMEWIEYDNLTNIKTVDDFDELIRVIRPTTQRRSTACCGASGNKQINRSLQVRKMKYRLPEINDKDILQKYVQEHHNNGETSISASLGLSSSDYTEWVTKIKNNALSGDEQWGKSLLYLCFDGDRLIGLLSVRYELPEVLSEKYGDIGYGVRPSERNKGYATAMLKYALSVCKEKGMEKVILGCYKENLASAATIQKNGGTLIAENENYKEGRTSQYYLIRL